MKSYDTYVLVLCLIVFAALTAMFTVLITCIVKMRLKMIASGLVDDEIREELRQEAKRKSGAAYLIQNRIIPIVFCLLVLAMFLVSIFINISSKNRVGKIPVMKVVNSSSMATKYENNTYLDENNITNRIQRFDLIQVIALPREEDLQLYDVVVYESDGALIVHRIVEIHEPNAEHAERQFLLQGDANQYPDRFPVRYEQMKGLYSGVRIPFVGSFVEFMHSPVGYLCVLLVVFVSIALPLIEKKLAEAIEARLDVMNRISPSATPEASGASGHPADAESNGQG